MKKASIVFLFSFIFLFISAEVYDISQNDAFINGRQQIAMVRPVSPVASDFMQGRLDPIYTANVSGWAGNPSAPAQQINVAFFIDTTQTTGIPLATVTAGYPRSDGSTLYPGYPGDHGFTYSIPVSYQDGQIHKLYTYAIDPSSGAYNPLTNSPQIFSVAPPVFVPPTNISVSSLSSYDATLTWSPVAGAQNYAIYLDGQLWDTTTSNTYDSGSVLISDTDYDITIQALSNFIPPPGTITSIVSTKSSFLASVFNSIWSTMLATVVGGTRSLATSVIPTKKIHTQVMPPIARKGDLKVLAILVDYLNSDNAVSSHDTIANVKTKLFDTTATAPASVKTFYDAQSTYSPNHSLNIVGSVAGNIYKIPYLLINNFNSVRKEIHPPLMYETIKSMARKDGNDPGKYDLLIYVWPYMKTNAAVGAANQINDINSIVNGEIEIDGVIPMNGYAHEIGHELGLYHAGSISCPDTPGNYADCGHLIVYGDRIDVMGNLAAGDLNPPHMNALGWIPSEAITESGRYDIAPVQSSSAVEYTIAKKDTNETYYLENNTAIKGYPNLDNISDHVIIGINKNVPKGKADPLGLHGGDPDTLMMGSLSYGFPFDETINKFEIFPLGATGDIANIYVRFYAAPTLSAGPVPYSSNIQLNWTWPAGEPKPTGGFKIYRDGNAGSNWIATISDPSATTFTDTARVPGTTYTYYVSGYDKFPEFPNDEYDILLSNPATANTTTGSGCTGTPPSMPNMQCPGTNTNPTVSTSWFQATTIGTGPQAVCIPPPSGPNSPNTCLYFDSSSNGSGYSCPMQLLPPGGAACPNVKSPTTNQMTQWSSVGNSVAGSSSLCPTPGTPQYTSAPACQFYWVRLPTCPTGTAWNGTICVPVIAPRCALSHYNCLNGTMQNSSEGVTKYTWQCANLGSSLPPASCTEPKTFTCGDPQPVPPGQIQCQNISPTEPTHWTPAGTTPGSCGTAPCKYYTPSAPHPIPPQPGQSGCLGGVGPNPPMGGTLCFPSIPNDPAKFWLSTGRGQTSCNFFPPAACLYYTP